MAVQHQCATSDRRFNPHPAFGPGATGRAARLCADCYRFQSSPGLRAGCYARAEVGQYAEVGQFQSSPGLRAGCYRAASSAAGKPGVVSILTRPSGRVLLAGADWAAADDAVSILTRPSGRVLLAGADWAAADDAVSILTRPSGRVLRPPPAAAHPAGSFNPHPAFGPGATGPFG